MNTATKCWCGNEELENFSKKYLKCRHCITLLSSEMPDLSETIVANDDTDFYGHNYWFSHQEKDFGFPNIIERSRNDLHERCIYWLKAVLKYKLPPGKTLEIGCSHGGFVSMLKYTGFVASGIELSPWVAEYARNTFDVPVSTGPVEEQKIEKETFSLVILMDVLEHLIDPLGTLQHCLGLLKKDGLLVVQTPKLDGKINYQEMTNSDNPFLNLLKEKEHLYLFSKNSITKMLKQTGFKYINFEEAIFKHYDMFLFASQEPIKTCPLREKNDKLNSSVDAKMMQALIDLDDSKIIIRDKLIEAETDRLKRLEVIQKQGQKLGNIESERNILQAQIDDLQRHVKSVESDRAARLDDLQRHVESVESDRAARLDLIREQGQKLGIIGSERNNLQAELTDLREHFEAAESDRAARLKVIIEQGQEIGTIQAENDNLQSQLDGLQRQFVIKEELLNEALSLLQTISKSTFYKIIRKFGFWNAFENGISNFSKIATNNKK